MKTARWEIVDAELRVWLGETWSPQDGLTTEPLHRWIEAVLDRRPFILIDVCAPEVWGRALASRQFLRMGLIQAERRTKYVMFGCLDPAVLEAHDEDDGCLAWVSGLTVAIFESEEAMQATLTAWNGQPFPDLHSTEGQIQCTLMTYADAACLIFIPGQEPLDKLFAAAAQTAARLGYSWAPLRPSST